MTAIAKVLVEAVPDVRYVATYAGGVLQLDQRPGIENASASESDKYEELIVNPTLLKLLEQRGNIDCGGMEHVIVRYGTFFEFVQPVPGGHVSVGIQPDTDLATVISKLREKLAAEFATEELRKVLESGV